MDKNAIGRFAAWARERLSEYEEQTAYAFFYRMTALYYMQRQNLLPEEACFPLIRPQKRRYAFDLLERWMPEAFLPATPDMLCADADAEAFGDALAALPEDTWRQTESIGWLYQFYRAKDKAEAFACLRRNEKLSGSRIPAATQIFTPDWVVQYLVQNSVGRLVAGGASPDWQYYLEEGADLPRQPTALEDIRILDPCMGSGHILVYAFSLLMECYRRNGVASSDAVRMILERNLYGFDIDGNVASLCCFQVLMQACRYDKNACRKRYHLHLYTALAVPENAGEACAEVYRDLSAYGSLYQFPADVPLSGRIEEIRRLFSETYDAVVTNPPYMGKKSLNRSLADYLAAHYPQGKSELYAAFMLRCLHFTRQGGFTAMVTIHSWMFLRSFLPLRQTLLEQATVSTLLHAGASTFEELSAFNALAAAFCLRKGRFDALPSVFVNLCGFLAPGEKQRHVTDKACTYLVTQRQFAKIPGCPFVYRLGNRAAKAFETAAPLGQIARPEQGMATADNKRFVRRWFEVSMENTCLHAADAAAAARSGAKWFPYNKGGTFRKWYGMNEYVVNWERDGEELKQFGRAVLRNPQDRFKSGITWSLFGFENFAVRWKDSGFLFDVSGASMFPERHPYYILAFLASKPAFYYLSMLAPTVNFQVGNIADLPYRYDAQADAVVTPLAKRCVELSKADWDDFALSWDFVSHPLLRHGESGLLSERFAAWEQAAKSRYGELIEAERRMNEQFIRLYDLEDVLTPDPQPRDIALRLADRERDAKDLLSYAVGCMFGRYSLDTPGLAYTGGKWDAARYTRFVPVQDNLIVLDDSEAGVLGRLKNWLAAAFGADTVEQNLAFLAESLPRRKGKSSEDVILAYFADRFLADHTRQYQKHPIYMMLASKNGAFAALSYLHRWDETLFSDAERLVCEKRSAPGLSAETQQELTDYAELLRKYVENPVEPNLDDSAPDNFAKISELIRQERVS